MAAFFIIICQLKIFTTNGNVVILCWMINDALINILAIWVPTKKKKKNISVIKIKVIGWLLGTVELTLKYMKSIIRYILF